ncbi:sigma-70 family RNA polymerase sigma factor [Myxosarcina sp. GI1]|uniref:sigma-70 family RNA polymerase sigma factor n=1 Tax=Myxosarcina sp. GI1 TaxID=1541065 RepID=UPI0005698903|nr:sigma-70 family RNA polymerase sigma factor [Myxosarcina sp. GI1]
MQRREDTVEIFSTFIKFEVDRFGGWIRDPKLRRSMTTSLQQIPDRQSKNFWALYWHKVWQTQPNLNYLAASHIAAYLQEDCYWAVKKFTLNVSGHSSLADYFQIAIAHIPKILKNFNPQYSPYLKSYAELSFKHVIKDLLRVRKEADICSDWSLLHKLSRKRLIKSLQYMGFDSQTIECYLLAWECYCEFHSVDRQRTRKLIKPDADTAKAIAELYNSEHLSRLGKNTSAINSQTLEKWLLACARAARNLLYPQIVSADTPIKDEGNTSLLDMMPDDKSISLLTQAIEREETASSQNYQTRLNRALNDAIAALKPEARQLLQVYYGKQLTQTEVAKQLNLKQYQVSRRLSSIKKSLLITLTKWSQQTLHISLGSDVIEKVNSSLEEWLRYHYHQNQVE